MNDSRPVRKVPCRRCHGFKLLDNGWPCKSCDANGMIEVYEVLPEVKK